MNNRKISLIGIIIFVFSLVIISSFVSAITLIDVAPKGFKYVELEDYSETTISDEIVKSKEIINQAKSEELYTNFMEDALYEAEYYYEEKDYREASKYTQLISFLYEQELGLINLSNSVESKELDYRQEGIETEEVLFLINLSKDAMEHGQVDESKSFLKEADDLLEQNKADQFRLGMITDLGKNFFVKYWWQISIILILIIVGSFTFAGKIRKSIINRKIERLSIEFGRTKGLIKKVQEEYLIEKKISRETYKSRVKGYEERIAEIKHTLPRLKAELSGRKYKQKNKEMGIKL